jgi:hypothetical protein
VFGRAPGIAGLVCLIRADSLAKSNWTVPPPTAMIFGSAIGQTTTMILLRTEAAIKLDSHFHQPHYPGASSARIGPNLLTITSSPTQIAECSMHPRKSREQ